MRHMRHAHLRRAWERTPPSHRSLICEERWAPFNLGEGVHEPAQPASTSSPTKLNPPARFASLRFTHRCGGPSSGFGGPGAAGPLTKLGKIANWLPPSQGKNHMAWHGSCVDPPLNLAPPDCWLGSELVRGGGGGGAAGKGRFWRSGAAGSGSCRAPETCSIRGQEVHRVLFDGGAPPTRLHHEEH